MHSDKDLCEEIGKTLTLPMAALSRSLEICQTLLRNPRPKKINSRDPTLENLLDGDFSFARDAGHFSSFGRRNASQSNMSNSDNSRSRPEKGPTALMVAAGLPSLELVSYLLACPNCDVLASTRTSNAFIEAAKGGSIEIVELLINKGYSVNSRAPMTERTALHVAASYGHYHLAAWLISKGADVNALDVGGKPPLFCALSLPLKPDTLRTLVDYGACDVTIISKHGFSALDYFFLSLFHAPYVRGEQLQDSFLPPEGDAPVECLEVIMQRMPAPLINRLWGQYVPRYTFVADRPALLHALCMNSPLGESISRFLIQHPLVDVHVCAVFGDSEVGIFAASAFELATSIKVHRGELRLAADDRTIEALIEKGAVKKEPHVWLRYRCESAIVNGDAKALRLALSEITEQIPNMLTEGVRTPPNLQVKPLIDVFVHLFFSLRHMPCVEVIRVLLDHGASPNFFLKPKQPLLLAAISAPAQPHSRSPTAPDDVAIELVARGADVNCSTGFYSILSTAISRRRYRVALGIIASGACNVDLGEGDVMMSLANEACSLRKSLAAIGNNGHIQLRPIRSRRWPPSFAESDAEDENESKEHNTYTYPLPLTIREGEIVSKLEEVVTVACAVFSRSLKYRDIIIESHDITACLLANGCSVNELEWVWGFNKGRPLIFRFVNEKNYEITTGAERVKCFQLALDHGMELDVVDDAGQTPINYALMNRWYALARLLLLCGAKATQAEEDEIRSMRADPLSAYGLDMEF